MKKRLWTVLCCTAMVFTLVACGGNDNNRKEDDDVTETQIEETEEVEEAWKDAYKEVLAGIVAEDGEYVFDKEEYGSLADYAQYLEDEHEYNPGYVYELYDVNVDGTPELFVKFNRGPGEYAPIYVFRYEDDGAKKMEKTFSEEIAGDIKFSTKYVGILSTSASRWTGETFYSVYEWVDGELVKVIGNSYTYDQTEDPKYKDTWNRIEWTDADDYATIENYREDNLEKESIVVEKAE